MSIGQRGQLSVEYLLLILVFLLILGSVTIPLIGSSIDAANDVSNTAAAKSIVDDIGNAVNIVYANGPGARRTLNVFVPTDMTLASNNQENILTMTLQLSDEEDKLVSSNIDSNVVVRTTNLNRRNYEAVIYWPSGSSDIEVTLNNIGE